MINLSTQDLLVRVELIEQYLASFGNDVAKQFMTGQKCRNKNFKLLALIDGYLSVLRCYNVIGSIDPNTGKTFDSTDNCITEQQAQSILEHISELTQIHFASIGTTYII